MTSAETAVTHTPPRSVRVPEELWQAARWLATARQETLSDVVNAALASYVLGGMTEDDDRRVTEVDREKLRRTITEDEVRRIIRRRTP